MAVLIRALIFVMSLLLPSLAQASTSYPKPLHTPHAEYPKEMQRNKQGGSVTVRIFIHANGSVSFRDVVKTSDPRFTEAMKQALSTWRFEAWTPPAESPDGESVLITFNFIPWTTPGTNLKQNAELKKLRCSQLNNELTWSRHNHPVEEAKTFRDTRNYLFSGVVIREFLPEAERQILLDEFDRAKPAVIENCRKNPTALYVDLLPEALRKML